MRKKIEVNERLLERIKTLYGIRTSEAAIDFALRSMLPSTSSQDILELEGFGWDGDLAEMPYRQTPRMRPGRQSVCSIAASISATVCRFQNRPTVGFRAL